MKRFYSLLSAMLMFSLALTFTNCNKDNNDDDDGPKSKKELLVDKWWYNNPDQGRGNFKFNSNNTLEATYPAPTSGTYEWGPNDSMYITMDGGAPPFTYHFITVEASVMEYWPTFEPEGNVYRFTTTEP